MMNIRSPRVRAVHLASSTTQALPSGPCWPHKREQNRRRIVPCLRVQFASLFAALILLGATPTAAVAAGCVEHPTTQSVQDGHWYYRHDSLNHRKCWYLQRQALSTGSSTAESESTVAMTLTSFFSSVFGTRQSAAPTKLQQEAAVVATTPEPSADPIAPKKKTSLLNERRGILNAKRAARLIELIQVGLEHADEQPQLDQAQRDVLFEEFLRWTVRREQAPSQPGQ